MKKIITITALCCLGALSSGAQLNSPGPKGYIERGIRMYEQNNFAGCLDQLDRLENLNPSPKEREQAELLKALSVMRLGSEGAVEMLQGFIDRYPASPHRADAMMALGDYYFNRGDYPKAITEYRKVQPMALTGLRPAAYTYRTAFCYMLLGETDTAVQQFTSLLGEPEWGAASRFYLGYIAYTKGEYDKALEWFDGADTSTAPGNGAPYYQAQIAFARGDWSGALRAARKLLQSGQVSEFTPECNRLAGEAIYNLGNAEEAAPYLWKYCAEAKNPQPSAYYILGVNEYRAGHTEEAVKLLQQAIGTNSAMEQSAWLLLGEAYLKRGDKTQALMAFENAYKLDFDRSVRETAFYNYAVARLDGGRVPFGSSVTLLENFLREYPDSEYASRVQSYIVNGYMTDGDYENALRAINGVKTQSPDILRAKQRVLFVLGTREYSSGKVASAIPHFTEAAALAKCDPDIAAQARLWLGDCYFARGNYADAAKSYSAFIAGAKQNTDNLPLAYYSLGYAQFSQEQYADALKSLRKAAELFDRSTVGSAENLPADTYNRMADCEYYLGNYAAAADHYSKAYSLNPGAGDYALYQRALMKGNLREYGAKLAGIDELMAKFPTSGLIPSALLEKAETYSVTGNADAALRTYSELVKLYPGTASGRNGYLQLAITYINKGERARGIETYKTVITSFPSSEEARVAADDLKQLYAADGRLGDFVEFINSVPNAPRYERSDLEKASFTAAENKYINTGDIRAVKDYVREYPDGAFKSSALYYLADAAWNEGKASEAHGYAVQVLLNHPDAEAAEDAMLIKGQAESAMGKTEIAHSTFLELESHASGSNMLRDARLGVMRTAFDLGKYADVIATADKLLASTAATTPADLAEVRFMRGMAYNKLGKFKEAYADWEEPAKTPADIFGAKSAYYLGQSLFDRGQLKKARTVADALISSDTPHQYWLARGFILYSDILRKEGNTFEANEYLKSIRNNYPGTEADIFQLIDSRLNSRK